MLVLSLFPGIGMLDMAFEEEGFTVVRGPDVLWGGDIRRFRPPSGMWDGVIGGPPCQSFSALAHVVRAKGHEPKFGNLIPEFERVVAEAHPRWFLMENVPAAPEAVVPGYRVHSFIYNNRWAGGVQHRARRFSFGTPDGRTLTPVRVATEVEEWTPAVTGDARLTPESYTRDKPGGGTMPHIGPRMPLEEMCRRQGLPDDFLRHSPFTMQAKRQMVGNGVPLSMGRAIARAVKAALSNQDQVAA